MQRNVDVMLPNSPGDTVQSLSVNGVGDMLVAGAWDNSVSCYQLTGGGPNGALVDIKAQAQIKHEAPVLCSDIATDNYTVFSGSCDGAVKMWDPRNGTQCQDIGMNGIKKAHDAGVRHMKFLPDNNLLLTSSWDKTMKLWDCRTPNPTHQYPMTDRVLAMDAKNGVAVAYTADHNIHVLSTQNGQPYGSYRCPIEHQIRCISMFTTDNGFAMGSIEGRVQIEYLTELEQRLRPSPAFKFNSFAFKCHREVHSSTNRDPPSDIYAVNAIDFHPLNTFATAGSDGTYCFWDHTSKSRLLQQAPNEDKKKTTGSPYPITCAKFSPQGNMFFYSVGYDWSKGMQFPGRTHIPNVIYYRNVQPNKEIQPKNTAAGNTRR